MWESRERRKGKEYDKNYEKEEQRKEDMVSPAFGQLYSILTHCCVPLFRRKRAKI